MKSIVISFIILLLCIMSVAQVPQGFNYQAVARDGSGNVLQNVTLQAMIYIQSSSSGGTVLWKELHSSVTTNGTGLFNLIVGTGTRQAESSVGTFDLIDWRITPKFLRTDIYYSGVWREMGTSQLMSVPYSITAGNLTGTVDKLSVQGTTSEPEEALFEVKNKDGRTVFAVYSEGVRVYVADRDAKGVKGGFAVGSMVDAKAGDQNYLYVSGDSIRAYVFDDPFIKAVKGGFAVSGFNNAKKQTNDYLLVSPDSVRVFIDKAPSTKAQKGGFAVSGFGNAKAVDEEYLRVTRDSTRIYINDLPGKAVKGGFAVSGFGISKGGTNYLNVSTDANDIINPSQNRIVWYPLKNAFLTGKVLIERPEDVGENSFSSGFESKAKGIYSQAMGYKSIAQGDYSTAIGKNALSGMNNSFAFGDGAYAQKNDSYSFGAGAIASGAGSYAIGSAGRDTMGVLTGSMTTASGNYSFAIGQGSRSTGLLGFAIGTNVLASGTSSTAMGYLTTANGDESTALGMSTVATGQFSAAIGFLNLAQGLASFVTGFSNEATGAFSTSMGALTKASGGMSISMGYGTRAASDWSVALGRATKAYGENSVALGGFTYASGRVATATGESTIASGAYSTSMGYYTKVRPFAAIVVGQYNDTTWSNGGNTVWIASDPLIIAGNGTGNDARSNAFTVFKNGKTAIGHSNPTQMLDVNGNARFRSVGSGIFGYNLNITADGTLTTMTSDARLKKDIIQLTNALESVSKLRGVKFTWEGDSSNIPQIGMIAQEVEVIVPELVFTNPVDGLKGINYSQATALLVEAIKEQQKQIESYKTQLQFLQEEVEQIKALFANGKSKLSD